MSISLRPLSWVVALLPITLIAQTIELPEGQYDLSKAAGTLPQGNVRPIARQQLPLAPVMPAGTAKGGGNFSCDCWIQPDANYTLAMTPNDDNSSGLITIPFQFNLYGTNYSNLYINNNGNISFDAPYGTFTADPFPTAGFVMVAPFWADIDTRGDDGLGLNGGTVKYKVTPTALYVNWDDCGYFSQYTDKKVFIQLIITDGNDPILGAGNNVSFCYKEMDWTTGDASGGSGGFGGFPAVVGANLGNGVDFIQFGTFDQPGTAYDGPFGNVDGVDWLDYKHFVFSTVTSTQNVAPIASSSFLCDTIVVCAGQLTQIQMDFIAPETGQITTATSIAPTLSTYVETSNTSGITATILSEFNPTAGEVGFHTITFSGTDNGVPPLTSTVYIVVEVVPSPGAPPTISGDDLICAGEFSTLTASGGFASYNWSNGDNGQSVDVGGGTYTVTGVLGNCPLTSAPFIVTENPQPQPVISGVLFNCGGEPATLGTTQPFTDYTWSNGSTDPTITVGTGTYSVTVTDANGCTGTSGAVNVLSAPAPTAGFSADPPSPAPPGTTVQFTDQSLANGANIVGWSWDFGDNSTSAEQNPTNTFNFPGNYDVTLTVTTSDGCTDTYTFIYNILPVDIIIPNVFSPNSDGLNDNLEFSGLQFYSNSNLKVYSRWGNKVYESANYRNNWNGKDTSEGTYFYILKMADGREYVGHVTLLR
ncbi:MAG: gliding motility-associated C-terminal domain-containing protein [Flavobacteriales bacterium]